MLGAAAILFALHAIVALVDGAYFHLYKYKLHTRPESVVEHFTHTVRAATMAAASFLFFVINAGGVLLWVGLGVIAVDVAVETWDVLVERRSRASLGGLSSIEYLSHAHAILLYAASYSLVLAAKPLHAFSLSAASVSSEPYPAPITWLGWAVCIGAVLSTIQHAVYLHPRYRRSAGGAQPAALEAPSAGNGRASGRARRSSR